MKKLLALCIAVMLLGACGQVLDEPTTAPTLPEQTEAPTTTSAPAPVEYTVMFTVTEHKLLPPEQVFDAEFEAFYKEFKAAVSKKDMQFIESMLDEGVVSSFGGGPGKEHFHEFWDSGEQDLWAELEAIIALGGRYYQAEEYVPGFGKCFVAPYIYTDFGGSGLDAFEHLVVIDKGVPVYEESCDPVIIETLDYSILEYHYSDVFRGLGPDDAVGVKTLSGEVGFIRKKNLRSPIDYRLCIEKKDDGWKLLWLIAGD